MTGSTLPAIERSISVSWDPDAAFRRFTADFASWWPSATHSIGGKRVKRVVFETHLGGRIYEEHLDGRRFLWGRILAWDPPRHVRFSWHPSREESTAQDVDLHFAPEGTGTRLTLRSSGWERMGKNARRERRGYEFGWGTVLDTFAGVRSGRLVVFKIIASMMLVVEALRGGVDASIARARGEITAR